MQLHEAEPPDMHAAISVLPSRDKNRRSTNIIAVSKRLESIMGSAIGSNLPMPPAPRQWEVLRIENMVRQIVEERQKPFALVVKLSGIVII